MLIELPSAVRLDVRHHGDPLAPPLLMVCTAAQPWVLWEPLAEGLAHWFYVVGYDQRGLGRSQVGRDPITLNSLTEDAVGLLDTLRIQRAHLLGWSLGSLVCQELAAGFPHHVAGLVLWGTWAKTDAFQRALLGALRYPWACGDLGGALAALALVFSPEHTNAPGAALRAATFAPFYQPGEAGMAAVAQQWEVALAHDGRVRLAGIAAPTLVVAGEGDILAPPRHGRDVAEAIAGARLETLAGAGASHALGLERPAEFTLLVAEFLLGVGSSVRSDGVPQGHARRVWMAPRESGVPADGSG